MLMLLDLEIFKGMLLFRGSVPLVGGAVDVGDMLGKLLFLLVGLDDGMNIDDGRDVG